uniref:Uncharacterized protein n=1 Tax=Oryza punctata TaxID=4537 RepID=A0A0E0KG88_ORYPU
MKNFQPHGPMHMIHRQAAVERCTAPHHNRPPALQSIPSPRSPPSTPVSSPVAGADLHPASRGGAGVLLLPPHHRSPVSILIHPIRPWPRPRISSPRPPLVPNPILRAEVAPVILLQSCFRQIVARLKFGGFNRNRVPLPSSTYFQVIN